MGLASLLGIILSIFIAIVLGSDIGRVDSSLKQYLSAKALNKTFQTSDQLVSSLVSEAYVSTDGTCSADTNLYPVSGKTLCIPQLHLCGQHPELKGACVQIDKPITAL